MLHNSTSVRYLEFIETEGSYQGPGEAGVEGVIISRVRVSVWDEEKVLEMGGGEGYTKM